MANPSINVDVGGNTAQLQREINRVANTPIKVNVATSAGSSLSNLPLGKISGDVSQIDKSLAAANARVVAFAASAGAIYALQSAVTSLVGAFVNVEKKLADINVLLNLSAKGIQGFGGNLFSIAANTAQSFDTVAEAATELARQGLGVEETLARTNDALILTRLSGLSAADSVNALTAAINSFSSANLDSADIINKFANVDAAFAVSSADLAEAIKRVGSAAQDAGVSFDELIAIVTTAQQVTARGGAVIGNSLKTIFTRLQRSDVQDLFGELGLSIEDSNGKIKSQIQLLQELAQAYDSLPKGQQSMVAEKVGGVFQINILKAALSDLSKEYSIYTAALETSIRSTDEAIQRNEELNKTLAARAAALSAKGQQAAITIAQPLVTPIAENILNIGDILAKIVNDADAGSFGAKIGKGLLDGIGSFIGGPGLALLTAAAAKLFSQFAGVASQAFKSILGTNQAAKEQAQLQAQIGNFLTQNGSVYKKIQQGQLSVNTVAQAYIGIINNQTQALQQQASVAKQIAQIIASTPRVGPISSGGRFYAGFIPNFAKDPNVEAEKAGARAYGYTAGKVVKERIFDGTGRSFMGYRNLAETRTDFINGDGKRATMIRPPNGFSKDTIMAFSGFIPNFAPIATETSTRNLESIIANKSGKRSAADVAAAQARLNELQKGPNLKKAISVGGGDFGYLYASGGPQRPVDGTAYLSDNTPIKYNFPSAGMIKPFNFKDEVNRHMTEGFNRVAAEIWPRASMQGGDMMQYFDKSSTNQTLGRLFEAAVQRAIRPNINVSGESGGTRFDIPNITADDKDAFKEIFTGGASTYKAAELKYSRPGGPSDGNVRSFLSKLLARQKGMAVSKGGIFATPRTSTSKKLAAGFIPNFANSLQQAISREQAAGVSSGSIYVSRERELASSDNPMGLGVFNKRDEPNRKARKMAMSAKGYSSGFIPNFALDDIDIASDRAAGSIDAFAASVSGVMTAAVLAFAFTNDRVKEAGTGIGNFAKDLKSGSFLKDLQKGFQGFSVESGRGQIKELQAEISKFNQRISNLNPNAQSAAIQNAISRYESSVNKLSSQLERVQYQTRVESYRQGMQTKGIGYGFLAQAIGGAVGGALGGADTRGGSIANLLGNVAGFAGLGASTGLGAIGAGIGGVVGLLTGIGPVIKSFDTELKEATTAASKAKESFQELQNSGQSLLQAGQQLETINKAIASGESVNFSDLDKAQEEFAAAMSKMPAEFQQQLTSFDMGSLMSQVAKAIEQKGVETVAAQVTAVGERLGSFNWGMTDWEGTADLGGQIGSLLERGLDVQKFSSLPDKLAAVGERVSEFGDIVQRARENLDKSLASADAFGPQAAQGTINLAYEEYAKEIRAGLSDLVKSFTVAGQEVPKEIQDLIKSFDDLSPQQLQTVLDNLGTEIADIIDRLATAAAPSIEVQRLDVPSKLIYDNLEKIISDFAQNAQIRLETNKAIRIDAQKVQDQLRDQIEQQLSQFVGAEKYFDFRSIKDKLREAFRLDFIEFNEGIPREAANRIAAAFDELAISKKDAIVKALESVTGTVDVDELSLNFSLDDFINLDKIVQESQSAISNAFSSVNWGDAINVDISTVDVDELSLNFSLDDFINLDKIVQESQSAISNAFSSVNWGDAIYVDINSATFRPFQTIVEDGVLALQDYFTSVDFNWGTLKDIAGDNIEFDPSGLIPQKINDGKLFLEQIAGSLGGKTGEAIKNLGLALEKSGVDITAAVNTSISGLAQEGARAAANLKLRFDTLSIDAQIQELSKNISDALKKASSFPRADLTGFTNPFKNIQQSFDDAIKGYQSQFSQIESQFLQGLSQAQGDPAAINQLEQQRADAINALNEDYKKQVDALNEQWKQAEQQAAKEAINIAAMTGDPVLIENAIQKYLTLVGDNIREYADYLGASEGEIRKAFADKIRVDAGLPTTEIADNMRQLDAKIKQRQQIIEDFNNLIESAPQQDKERYRKWRDDMLGSMEPITDGAQSQAEAMRAAVATINEEIGKIKEAGTGLSTHFGTLGTAAVNAAKALNNINPSGQASGFIPNFAVNKADVNKTKKLETKMSGKPAQFYTDPFPHVRNSSQPTFQSAMRDHGGLSNALKDSVEMQMNNGMIKATGFIPNFMSRTENMRLGIESAQRALGEAQIRYNDAQKKRSEACSRTNMRAAGFIPNFAKFPTQPPQRGGMSDADYNKLISDYNIAIRENAAKAEEEKKLEQECWNTFNKTWRSKSLTDMITLWERGFNQKFLHIKNAMGFIPNFAGGSSVSPAEKMMEKTMARQHGYTAGLVQKRKIWDGNGNSFTSVVNSAEDIFDFVNSKGRKATMVVPPNGFANGYVPQIDSQPTESNNLSKNSDNLDKNFDQLNDSSSATSQDFDLLNESLDASNTSFKEMDKNIKNESDALQESVSALNEFQNQIKDSNLENLMTSSDAATAGLNSVTTSLAGLSASIENAISSSSITVEPEINVEVPEINVPAPEVNVAAPNVTIQPMLDQNVTLQNPTVAANISVNVAGGMSSIDSAVAEIKSKIASALTDQEAAISELNKQLADLAFSISRA